MLTYVAVRPAIQRLGPKSRDGRGWETHRLPSWPQLGPASRLATRQGTASATTASGTGAALAKPGDIGVMQEIGDKTNDSPETVAGRP